MITTYDQTSAESVTFRQGDLQAITYLFTIPDCTPIPAIHTDLSPFADDEDDVGDLPDIKKDPPKQFARGPRQSVSAEAYGKFNQKKDFTPPVFPKTEEQKKRIRSILEQSFLFNALDEKDLQTVIMAIEEKVRAALLHPHARPVDSPPHGLSDRSGACSADWMGLERCMHGGACSAEFACLAGQPTAFMQAYPPCSCMHACTPCPVAAPLWL